MPGLVVAALLTLVWLAGLINDNALRSLAVGLFNFVGAWSLAAIATRSPVALRQVLLGLTLGLLLLGIGDLLFTWALNFSVDTRVLRQPIYIAGVFLLLVMGSMLPFSMERQGLYSEGFSRRVVLLALLGGAILAGLSFLVRPLPTVDLLYAGAAFYLTLVFVQQAQMLAGGRIGRALQGVVWALVLGSLARIVTVLGGAEPARWSVVVYDLLWISAMSVLTWSARRGA
ncbi:MAG: hypothetical protein IVW51_08890 [Thermaceae bacterium]|nr:hypothetical protein [Thermaceae bacterium]